MGLLTAPAAVTKPSRPASAIELWHAKLLRSDFHGACAHVTLLYDPMPSQPSRSPFPYISVGAVNSHCRARKTTVHSSRLRPGESVFRQVSAGCRRQPEAGCCRNGEVSVALVQQRQGLDFQNQRPTACRLRLGIYPRTMSGEIGEASLSPEARYGGTASFPTRPQKTAQFSLQILPRLPSESLGSTTLG